MIVRLVGHFIAFNGVTGWKVNHHRIISFARVPRISIAKSFIQTYATRIKAVVCFRTIYKLFHTFKKASGHWQTLPLLPAAEHILLPLLWQNPDDFKLILLPLTDKSLMLSEPVSMLGLRGIPHADLTLEQVDLSSATLWLSGNDGLKKMSALWSQAEVCMLAIRSAIADSSYQTAVDYAQERYQGGKIIIEHSLMQKMLANFYREKSVIYELWQSIGRTLEPYRPLTDGQLSLTLNTAEKLPWLASDGIQILGGIGYMEDFPQERRYRDAKQCEFLLGHPQAKSFDQWHRKRELS